ncbi:hypothetical protein P879_09914 [Paragonimus westermani]|uniref:Uncharacterized protein n=1 Tax=Paragonimus westermani TaxID=34504 RepID=A0A8T0DM16_9TREM|nr:hypothetical protein P879_09914 [Paragonimus westermani]
MYRSYSPQITYCLGILSDILTMNDDMNSIVIETIIEDVPILSTLPSDSKSENVGPKFTAGRMTVCSGTVLAVSDVHCLTETASYSCPDLACTGSTEYRITKPTLSGTRKLELATCAYCGTQMTEELHKRSSSETIYFLLLPQPIRGSGKSAGVRGASHVINRAVLCAISGKLIRKLHLGMQVHLIGIPELTVVDDSFQWIFKVQNTEYTSTDILDPWKCALNAVIDKLPSCKLIRKLHLGMQVHLIGIPELTVVDDSFQWIFKVQNTEYASTDILDPWKCALNAVIDKFPSYVHNFEFGIVFTLAYMFLGKFISLTTNSSVCTRRC